MGFRSLQNLFNSFIGKDRFTKTQTLNYNEILNATQPVWVSVGGQEAHLFNTTPQLYFVILTKAQMYANGVFKHLDKNGVEIENSEFVKLLNNPNPLQSRNEWLMEELIMTSVFGNSFVYSLKPFQSSLIPSAMYNLPSGSMKVVPTGKMYQQTKIEDIIEKFVLIENSTETTFKTSDVIFSKTQNPSNKLIGISPLVSIQMPISNIRGAYGFRNVLIEKKGAIGILSNQSKNEDGGIPLNGDERKNVEKQYAKDYGNGENQSKVIITSASLNWQPMTFPTKDLMLFEEISADLMSIIDTYGMNEYLFSKEKGSTFANLNEGKKMAYQDTIIPYANDFAQKLTDFFKLSEKNEKIVLDYSHIEVLQENEKAKAQTIKIKADALKTLKEMGTYSDAELKDIINL